MKRISVAIEGAGSVTVLGTSTEVVAAVANRNGLEIVNDSDTKIYLALGTAAVVGKGIPLSPNGGSWSPTGERSWLGTVNAISSVATKTLCYVEY